MNASLENHMVIGDADEYERQTGQEFEFVRRARARLNFRMDEGYPLPVIEVVEPMFLAEQAE